MIEDELVKICEAIDKLVQNQDARIYVSGEHALDESLVFGTTDAYLRFASELLKFIVAARQGKTGMRNLDGISIHTSGSINGVFDQCSEIIFDNSDLVETEAEARQLFEYLWNLQHANDS